MNRRSGAFLIVCALIGACTIVSSQRILVDDLELTTEMGKYSNPSDITFTEDGTLWACNKRGILTASTRKKYDKPRKVLDLRRVTCEDGERGLLGVAPHFDFGRRNPYVYLIYTYKKYGNCKENGKNGPVTRISRFTCDATGDLDCDIDSEEVFLESPSFPFDHHNSGAIKFGKDGLLYATIGDGGISSTAQERSNVFGTVVRLTPENTIPRSNPYSVESGFSDSVRCGRNKGESGSRMKRCQEIFAYGLRNPSRVAMNPNIGKTEFYINDVGESIWEEVNVGGDGYEGANYGWPIREGPCKKGSDCGKLCREDNTYEEPIHFYHHGRDGEGTITGGAFVPNSVWPSEYDGMYLYADYDFGEIFMILSRGSDERDSCPLRSDYRAIKIVDFPYSEPSAMAFNPRDNALYFLTQGFGGRLNRIRFVGEGNRRPQPVIRVSANGGEVGTTIEFDGTDSTDPDGDSLKCEWDFDGDGDIDSTEAIDSFRYDKQGIYEASLKVRDRKGGRLTTSVIIGIGEYPGARIVKPQEGTHFFVGEEFVLRGEAMGDNIGDSDESMMWEVKHHYGDDFQSFLEPTSGNRVRLQPAPSPEDFLASENSYLEVILTVTNEFGLSTTVSRKLMPMMRRVEIDSTPSGRIIKVDDFEVVTPVTFYSWANHPLKLEAPDDDWFAWTSWDDRTHIVTLSIIDDDVMKVNALFGKADDHGCFAGETTVEVMNKGTVPMKDLTIGDHVKVAGDKFSQVYSFGHYEPNRELRYLSIDTGLEKPLLITPDHMLFVNGKAIPASLVSIGDSLSRANGGSASVESIKYVIRGGAFAPFTADGTIVVNDVVASSFVALVPDSPSLVIGGVETVSLHGLAYLFEAPHRLVCALSFGVCSNESYSKEGLSAWIEAPLVFSQWILGQAAFVQVAFCVPALVMLAGVAMVEIVANHPMLLLMALASMLVLKRKTSKG